MVPFLLLVLAVGASSAPSSAQVSIKHDADQLAHGNSFDGGGSADAVRAASRHAFPTGDVDQMLAEIERGYVGEGAP